MFVKSGRLLLLSVVSVICWPE